MQDFFSSTWKGRKDMNQLITEIWLIEVLKQGRGKETHGHLLLSQLPEIHAQVIRNTSHIQKKQLVQTCSTVVVRTDQRYKQHFRRCHCLPWLLLTCKLWADIPHIIIYSPSQPVQQTTAAPPDIHRYTLCFTDAMVRGAKEHNYGWNNIRCTLIVYPVPVNWVSNVSSLEVASCLWRRKDLKGYNPSPSYHHNLL